MMFDDGLQILSFYTSDLSDSVLTPGEHDITITATAGTNLDVSDSLTIKITL